jgi:apolipoprotein N-acyltransferase
LPTALPPTVYAQLRDIPIVVIVAIALLLVIRRRLVRRTA